MRIVVTVSDQAWGGKHRYMFDIAAGLQQLGHEVVVVAESGGRMASRCRAAGMPCLESPPFAQQPDAAAEVVRTALSSAPAGVLIATGRHDMAVVHTAAPVGESASPVVVFRHSAFELEQDGPARALLDRADLVFATSREQLERQFPADPRAEVLMSGVSQYWRERTAAVDRGAASERLGVAPDAFVFAVLARLSWEKGVDRVLRAFAALGPDAEDPVLVVAGDGEEADAIARLAGELGVADRVRLLGHVDDAGVADVIVAADAVVLASTVAETGPLVLKEAMAAGRAVVASRIGGIGEFVTDGESGLLVGDDDELVSAMRALTLDASLVARLGKRAQAVIEEGHLLERRVRHLGDRLSVLAIRALPLHDVLGELSFDEVRCRPEAASGLVFVPHTSQLTELDSRTFDVVAAAVGDADPRAVATLGDTDARATAELLYDMGALSHAGLRKAVSGSGW
ncbi:glycosyltransferase family 4 protein [Lentzea flaviverrucosa]|uniref:Glycosyltransferase involved in cell wall bisynthesis n=1 Tax=Lentzea flaviverrucosa TaxID=200379 RepID=A0A1H9WTR8_9PSEU|nr:glycosyltransferase family 4 protein [Lentzea flaviverrucosa]RDI23097.1 glycosyltransferase involved in cell wall biosynthesis [Lentzea flaviverrucosa]SES37328.1 Glycosyltransferase involved in cell wall bisynthesis [Lentzea flaviverrucosa]